MLGEWLVLYAYSRLWWPLEPYREKKKVGKYVAAYDPRRKLYHFMWRAEPVITAFGIGASHIIHELYAGLALKPEESIAFFQLGKARYIRYTARAPDESRVMHVETLLREYFVLYPAMWVSSPVKPNRWIYAVAAAPAVFALANPAALLAALALLYHANQTRKWYREAVAGRFEAASTTRDLGTSRQALETYSRAEALAMARMAKWGVAFSPRPEAALAKEYKRAYESPVEKASTTIKLRRASELMERMLTYDERPIQLTAFGSSELSSQLEIKKSPLATALFWMPLTTTKGLTHDLCRFPVFYGGNLPAIGRTLEVGVDRFDRPVTIDLDAMPAAHAVVLGPSGMGKSWAVATFARKLAAQGLSVIIVDPHGDYVKLAKLIGAEVFQVPKELPPLKPLEDNRYMLALLSEFGLSTVEDAVAALAAAAKVDKPAERMPGTGHVVYDLRMLKHDADASALAVSIILLYYLTTAMERTEGERLSRVVIVDEAALLMRHARITETGVASSGVLDLIRQYTLGGRKYGAAIWLIAQLADHLPDDIIKSAAFVLQLGGPGRALTRSIHLLALDEADVDYLVSATTPRETATGGGKPYAMGVLLLSPRHIKYPVKIPLDPEVK
nr:MAG: hypothetical protein TU35_06480 [Thermoproteus sp. AZ2]